MRQYPDTIPLSRRRLPNAQSQPPTKVAPMPLYAAGFMMDPHWLFHVYLPRIGIKNVWEIIPIALVTHGEEL